MMTMLDEERIDKPTPNGGVYSVARYLRDGEPVDKSVADEIEVVEG